MTHCFHKGGLKGLVGLAAHAAFAHGKGLAVLAVGDVDVGPLCNQHLYRVYVALFRGEVQRCRQAAPTLSVDVGTGNDEGFADQELPFAAA